MQESWEDVRQTPERFIEVDAERTVAVVGFRGGERPILRSTKHSSRQG